MTTFCGKNLHYTRDMKIQFALAEPAGKPKTDNIRMIALLLAVILLVMVLAQLFSFEKFVPLIEKFGFPGGEAMAVLVAGVIVISEVFTLPFLLRMRLSPLMRLFSMICGWLVVAGWLMLAVWANITKPDIETIGFLGTSIDLPVGWWAVAYVIALGILTAWVSWGMWPGFTGSRHLKK